MEASESQPGNGEAHAQAATRAVETLRGGGIVCLRTESSYGLAADLRCADACLRIGVLKERPDDSPFPVIAGSLATAITVAQRWPKIASDLAARHWPGPLTLVVAARPGLPAQVVGQTGGVGVRVSSDVLARELAVKLGGPFTATSANRRGHAPSLTAADARAVFGDKVDFYYDSGPAPGAAPSTVVWVKPDGALEVLRPGPVVVAT